MLELVNPIVSQRYKHPFFTYHEVKLCWFFTQYFYFYLG